MKRPEQALQIAVMTYLRTACPNALAFSIPNGGYRRPIEACIMKATGTLAGVPDILILWEPGRCGFIELKAPGAANRLSVAQKSFQIRAKILGVPNRVATSLDDVRAIVRDWDIPCRERRIA